MPPVADAGPSRYVATEPIRLDGTGSHDPDGTPIMGYTWMQVSGPALRIAGTDTSTPAVSGFVQTDAVQPCVFELAVSDGHWLSPPARVELSIVPEFGSNRVELYNDALDVAIRINRDYKDPRYAINRVTLLDTTGYCRDDVPYVQAYLSNPVAGEQCWVDNYVSTIGDGFTLLQSNVLNVVFNTYSRVLVNDWYGRSLLFPDMNDGVVAGAYLSVIGQGRNLQLAHTPGRQAYKFKWYGDDNAVLYQHLFGSTPEGIDDYGVIAQAATPLIQLLTSLPHPGVWWTVRVWDKYGSSIHTGRIRLDAKSLHLPVIRAK